MKRVVVTGATGFIGRQTISFLKERGYEIHAFSSKSLHSNDSEIIFYEVNLFDFSKTSELVKKIRPTHLLHLAWNATPGKFWTSVDNLAWVEASSHLARAFVSSGGKRIAIAGTCAEYDWNWSGHFSEEKTPFLPSTLYGVCKRSLYQILESFCKNEKIELAWGYVFYLFGPHEHENRLIPSVIQNLFAGKDVLCSHGNQTKDFLDVRDVARAFVEILDSSLTGGINIGSGEGISVRQVVEKIASFYKGPASLKFGALPAAKGEPMELVADVKRLKGELGWVPRYSLDQGLKEAVYSFESKQESISFERSLAFSRFDP